MPAFMSLQQVIQESKDGIEPTLSRSHMAIFYPYNIHRYAYDGESVSWDMGDENLVPLRFSPVAPDHSLVDIWDDNGIGLKVATLLEESNVLFDAIDFACRRQLDSTVGNNDDHAVVITIRTLPAITPSLTEVLKMIHELTGGLTVEIRQGRVDILSAYPTIGSSMGIVGNLESNGTIGGFFNLLEKNGDVVAHCALVCEHVIRPYTTANNTEMSRPFAENTESYIRRSRNSRSQQGIYCTHPSQSSHLQTVAKNRKTLVQLAGQLVALKYSNPELQLPAEQQNIEKEKSRIQRITTQAINRNSLLGSVYASSGYRFTAGSQRLDWALVEIHNAVPLTRANKVENRSTETQHIKFRRILHAGKPPSNGFVYKQGSTTGITSGVINPVLSYIASYDANGNRKVTAELCVIPDRGFERFAGPGDSGSLVLECRTANVLGMVFGGHLDGEPAYFSSISAMAKDIRKVTGLDMQIPGGSLIKRLH